MSIVSDVYGVLRERTREAKQVKEKLSAVEEKIRSGNYSSKGLGELYTQRDELKRELNIICSVALNESKKIVTDYQEQLRAEECLNPSELTDDVRLLSSGIPLLPRDVKAILERSKTNRTMTQLALRYAEAHDIDVGVEYKGNAGKITEAETLNSIAGNYVKNWMQSDIADQMLGQYFGTNE